eukprot:180155-Chlamydomonas_euryale.AAC.1
MDASGAAQKQPKANKEYLCGTCCVVLNVVRPISEHPGGVLVRMSTRHGGLRNASSTASTSAGGWRWRWRCTRWSG